MSSMFIFASVYSIIFLIIKIVGLKFTDNETSQQPLKYIIKDTMVVYCSIIIGSVIYNQIMPLIHSNNTLHPQVFTGEPNF